MKSRLSVSAVFLISFLCYSQSDIRIISSDYNSITIEYTPAYTDTSKIEIQNELFTRIDLLFGDVINPELSGIPAIPLRIVNLGVPQEFGNTLQVIASSYTEIMGKIIPKPSMRKNGALNETFYEISEAYNSVMPDEDLVTFGEYGLMREIRTQNILLKPIRFYPEQNKIRLYNKIVFRLNYSSNQNLTTPVNDDLCKDAIINFDIARSWSAASNRMQKINTNSVLANGRWFRFEAHVEGMYRITYSMLASYGIDAASVDPRTIKIYNNGGKMLPESILAEVPTDLIENAIQVIGEDDGVFNTNDYILFYGRGTSFWEYDSSLAKIVRRHNVYSKENYFWITSGGNAGKRIQTKQSLTGTGEIQQTNTNTFAFLEEEKVNFVQSGRFYFGDEFNSSTRSRSYMNTLTGLVENTPVSYNFRFINNHSTSQLLTVEENGNQIYSSQINGTSNISDWNSYLTGVPVEGNVTFSGGIPANRSVLKFTFNANSVLSRGHLDYFNIQYLRNLNGTSGNLLFYSIDTTAILEYQLSGFPNSNISVFDITDNSNVKVISNQAVSGGDYKFVVQENKNKVSKYFALVPEQYLTPGNAVEIANSNIHGISTGAKFIVVTHRNFRQQADRLKNYRENISHNKFSTIVVDIDEIFNEFSGGMTDVSGLRNFIKYAYDNWEIQPEYVLLLGDGDYDYRNIEGVNKNFILTYQVEYPSNMWYRNLHHFYSHPWDDFYALISGTDPFVDIAIGRIDAQSTGEVSDVIDKIISYESDKERKSWRNLITLIADDGYTSTNYEGDEHTRPSENLSNNIIPKSFDINKIYGAAYPDVLTSAGRRKPAVNAAILDAINEGTLILNYIGHGSPDLWAHEVIFDKNISIPQMRNDKYFFLSAATCDFGYFDIPGFQSATELMVLQRNAGCIAAISSARLVLSGENHSYMNQFFNDLLNSDRDSLNRSIPIGKVNLKTKQVKIGLNDRKYLLFGDPTLRLNIPQYYGKIDSINGIEPTANIQIKALSRSKVEGEILRPDSTLWGDFNGEAILTVFDSQRRVLLTSINNYAVNIPGGVIFRGRISVKNGKFKSEFIVPKDISYENRNGKILVYFYNDDVDGIIFTDKVIIGGTDSTTVNDGKGPEISIHFDDASFNNANLITPNSMLVVKLSDETGLNTTGSGIGHKLEGILNENENNPLDFSNFFTGDIDAGGRSGEINYRFSNLEHGEYKIRVKAWDVFNNFNSESTFFSVVSADELVVRDIYNYPNPFSSNTTFTFQHNLNSSINLKIKIYTVAGRLIHELEKQNLNDRFVTVDWDGRDTDGDLIANGTYLYKIVIMTTDGNYKKDVLGKLAVIR